MADVERSMSQEEAEQTSQSKTKKVRLACQRCRERRIKCDGQTPSCSKCAKAGVPCIDPADAHRGGSSVPRAFLANAQSRLEWLENIVRTQLPDVDLSAGPENSQATNPNAPGGVSGEHWRHSPLTPNTDHTGLAERNKRPSSSTADGNVTKRARRMAADIGLFSLNPNAAQYLGSSSGSFFADLLRNELPSGRQDEAGGSSDRASDSDSEGVDDGSQELQNARQHARAVLKTLKELLPQREQCDRMIKLFFTFYHADYPVLHQPSFMALVDALYASAKAPADTPLQHNGWPAGVPTFRYNDEIILLAAGREAIPIHLSTGVAHLCFVIGIAADLQTRKRSYVLDPKPYATQAMASLQASIAQVSLSSVQTLVLYVLHSFLSSEGGRIWVILHIAMSYAIDMGLQRDHSASGRFSPVVLQMRRRVFLTLYTLERFVSTIQGRPIGFEDHTLDLAMPSILLDVPSTDAQRLDQAFLPYSIAHFQWASIVSELKYRFYRLLPVDETLPSVQDVQSQLQTRLEGWLQQSMLFISNLNPSEQPRFRSKLHIDYYFAIGLLYQPSRVCPRPSAEALRHCFDSAKQRIRHFDSLYYQNNLSLSWPRTHGVFLAGATLVYCIWTSTEIRSTVSVAEVAGDLRLCSSLLALGGEWWPLAQRGKRSFERLADSTLQSLMTQSTPALPPAQPSRSVTAISDDFSTSAGMPAADNSWLPLDVEKVLQSFLQNDLQFPDLLNSFDVSVFDPSELCFDSSNWLDSNLNLSS